MWSQRTWRQQFLHNSCYFIEYHKPTYFPSILIFVHKPTYIEYSRKYTDIKIWSLYPYSSYTFEIIHLEFCILIYVPHKSLCQVIEYQILKIFTKKKKKKNHLFESFLWGMSGGIQLKIKTTKQFPWKFLLSLLIILYKI